MRRQPRLITYDAAADSLYIYFVESPIVARTRNYSDNVVLDFDDQGKLVGIEIIDFSEFAGLAGLVDEHNLDPDLPEVLKHIRSLQPKVHRELVIA